MGFHARADQAIGAAVSGLCSGVLELRSLAVRGLERLAEDRRRSGRLAEGELRRESEARVAHLRGAAVLAAVGLEVHVDVPDLRRWLVAVGEADRLTLDAN